MDESYEMSHKGPGPSADVFDWDEARDPAAAPRPPRRVPWHMLGRRDRLLLDALAEGAWTPETALRAVLGWTHARFFWSTARMVVLGWIEARPGESILRSEYRLSEIAWR